MAINQATTASWPLPEIARWAISNGRSPLGDSGAKKEKNLNQVVLIISCENFKLCKAGPVIQLCRKIV